MNSLVTTPYFILVASLKILQGNVKHILSKQIASFSQECSHLNTPFPLASRLLECSPNNLRSETSVFKSERSKTLFMIYTC